MTCSTNSCKKGRGGITLFAVEKKTRKIETGLNLAKIMEGEARKEVRVKPFPLRFDAGKVQRKGEEVRIR